MCLGTEGLIFCFTYVFRKPIFSITTGIASKLDQTDTERFKNSIGMEFVYISPRGFMMGSLEDEPRRSWTYDETLHRVTLTHGFYMQSTEVTQGQWKIL